MWFVFLIGKVLKNVKNCYKWESSEKTLKNPLFRAIERKKTSEAQKMTSLEL